MNQGISITRDLPATPESNSHPLPVDNPFNNGPAEHIAAYARCLQVEALDQWGLLDIEEVMLGMPPRISARVLGFGLIHAPSDIGKQHLADEINDSGDDLEMFAGLAYLYVFGLIRIFYNPKGPTPAVSTAQSGRVSFEQTGNILQDMLIRLKSRPEELKPLLLERDRNRCIFSGKMDWEKATNMVRLGQGVWSEGVVHTQVAHIISQTVGMDVDIPGVTSTFRSKLTWSINALTLLDRFGGFDTRAVLGTEFLHHPFNAFTSDFSLHAAFDQLDLWLVPAKDHRGNVILDVYDTQYAFETEFAKAVGVRDQITVYPLYRHNTFLAPAPHPQLLAIHAACCKIAHMSAAADILKTFFRDPEPMLLTANEKEMAVNPVAVEELTRLLHREQFFFQAVSA